MTEIDRPIRVLVAKVGLDGHDRGAKVVARALRDAVIGVSILSGAHMTVFPRIIELLKEGGADENTLLLGGGVMPDEDVEELKQMGVAEILGQDTPPDTVVETVRRLVEERGARV